MSTFGNESIGAQLPSNLGQFDNALRAIAAARGKSPEDILKDADQHIEEAIARPRQGCLLPDDLVEYHRRGELPPRLELHVFGCLYCSRLLRAAKPDPNRVKAFRQAVAEHARSNDLRPVTNSLWHDWRAVASVAASVAICAILVTGNSPTSSQTNDISSIDQLVLTAKPVGDEDAVAVIVRVRAPPTSITVNAKTTPAQLLVMQVRSTQIAASTIAVAKNPPELTLPPYGSLAGSNSDSDQLHQQATEKTVVFVADMLPEWIKATGDSFDVMRVARQVARNGGGVKADPDWDAQSGILRVGFNIDNRKFATSFNLAKMMQDAQTSERLLEGRSVNSNLPSNQFVLNGVELLVNSSRAGRR